MNNEISDESFTDNLSQSTITSFENEHKPHKRRKQHRPQRNETNGIMQSPKRLKHETFEEEQVDADENKIAYCTLCKKEFCNKYFLKSHMSNKHNGVLIEPHATVYLGSQGSIMTHFKYVSPKKHLLNQHCEEQQQQQQQLQQKVSSVLVEPQLDTTTTTTSTTHAFSTSTNEDYCDLCQKHFCNKYYLRKHKLDVHGIHIENNIKPYKKHDKPRSSTPIPQTPAAASLVSPKIIVQESPLNLSQSKIPSHSPLVSQTTAPNLMLVNPYTSFFHNTFPTSSNDQQLDLSTCVTTNEFVTCDLCSKSFKNKDYLKLHVTNKHRQESLQQEYTSSIRYELKFDQRQVTRDSFCFICEQDFASKRDLKQHLFVRHARGTQQQNNDELLIMDAKCLDKVTCNICNKQLCNKYFLKTHKAKVHKMLNDENDMNNDDEDDVDNNYDEHVSFNKHLQMQPFFVESNEKQFADNFMPCLIYLPVKTKLNASICLNLSLKPIDTNVQSPLKQQQQQQQHDSNENEQAIDYSLKKAAI